MRPRQTVHLTRSMIYKKHREIETAPHFSMSFLSSHRKFDKHVSFPIKGSINRRAPGIVNFVLALAYHFCLNLPAAFTQPGARLLVEHCTHRYRVTHQVWTELLLTLQCKLRFTIRTLD